MEPFKLTQPELKRLNQGLSDLEVIESDLEAAKAADVPNMEEMIAACQQCRENIVKLKTAFGKRNA